MFLCFISTDSTDCSVCCSSYKLSWVHSQFLPRSLKAERADGVVGINTRLDCCRQTQRDRQQNKSTVFKTTSVGWRQKRGKSSRHSSLAMVAEPTDAHDTYYYWIKCFISSDLMGWNPLLSVDGRCLTLKCIIKA